MYNLKKTMQTIILLLLILLFFLVILLIYIYYDTKPILDVTIKIEGLRSTTEIIRDNHGVPSIYAKNDFDAYFTLGYATAQDRLWQISVLRLISAGRVSEILGEKYLPMDKFFRNLLLYEHSKEIAEHILSENKDEPYIKYMFRFLEGINTYITHSGNDLPIEFRITSYKPEYFKLHDIYAVYGLLYYTLSFDKSVIGNIINKFGIDPVSQLLFYENIKDRDIKKHKAVIDAYGVDCNLYPDINMEAFYKIKEQLNSLLGNVIAVSSERSKMGNGMIYAELSMSAVVPSLLYEAHIATPEHNFYGYYLPLSPFGFMGHNDKCLWAVNTSMVDDRDYYLETINPVNPYQYKYKGEWVDMDIYNEKFKIKGKEELEKLSIRRTRNGVIISDLDAVDACGKALSFHWLYYDYENLTNENEVLRDWFKSMYIINHAENYKQFSEGMTYYSGLGLNFIFADVYGNTAHLQAGKIPVRKDYSAPLAYTDNTLGLYDWEGYRDYSGNKITLNPDSGIIIDTNSKTLESNQADEYITYFYYDDYRIAYMYDRLMKSEEIGIDDIEGLMSNNFDLIASKVVPLIINYADINNPEFSDIEKNMLKSLIEWDYKIKYDEPSAVIFYEIYKELISVTIKDELGNDLAEIFTEDAFLSEKFINVLMEEDCKWFDNINTQEKENITDVFVKAVKNTSVNLKSRFGNNINNWLWSKYSVKEYKHILSDNFIYNQIFDVISKNNTYSLGTVRKGKLNRTYNNYKPVVKMVLDAGDPHNSQFLLFPANSGHFHSLHYKDQVDMNVSEKLRNPPNTKSESYKFMDSRTKLVPAD